MASGSTVTISYQFGEKGDGLKTITVSAKKFKQLMGEGAIAVDQLKAKLVNFAALQASLMAVNDCVGKLKGFMGDLSSAFAVQQEAETKLETVMRQRMSATDAEIQSFKDLASAQQAIGVIGDEVQLAGMQQVATFLKEKDSLATLTPAMNNLIAQQRGLNATSADAVSVGNLLGKAMQGQTAALQRVGITFSEAQGKVMKYGTESEKAAMLSAIITQNVGDMNSQLAQTSAGKQKQMANALGDIKEKLGQLAQGAMPFMSIAAATTTAITGAISLTTSIKAMTVAMIANGKAAFAGTAKVIQQGTAWLAMKGRYYACTAAMWAFSAAQKVVNFVLSANPIGLVIMAIGGLVTAIVLAYKHCESFRNMCNALWGAIKPLATAIVSGLAKAFSWLADKVKIVWNWIKKILGISGSKVEVDVDVVTDESTLSDMEALIDKYKDYKPEAVKEPKLPKAKAAKEPKAEEAIPDLSEVMGRNLQSLEAYDKAISDLERIYATSSKSQIANVRECIAALQDERAAFEALPQPAKEIVNLDVNPLATKLRDVEKNISNLRELLQDATEEEAADINRAIALWEKKAAAIKGAGAEIKKETETTSQSLLKGYGALKGIGSGIEGTISAIEGSGSAWKKLTGIVDGAISVMSGFEQIKKVLESLGIISTASAAKQVAASTATTTAAYADAEAQQLDAASKAMNAHAWIPFAGIGIAAAMVAMMIATMATLPKYASGGIAYGPTAGVFGEYPGARSNPEVVAPLSKLEGILAKSQGGVGGKVEFIIKENALYGVLKQGQARRART